MLKVYINKKINPCSIKKRPSSLKIRSVTFLRLFSVIDGRFFGAQNPLGRFFGYWWLSRLLFRSLFWLFIMEFWVKNNLRKQPKFGYSWFLRLLFLVLDPPGFPRDPFLFPLPPEFSLVVRYRATQTQRKQTAAKATVVNKKIWFFSKNFSKAYRSITLQYLLSTRNFLATDLRFK